MGGIFSTTTTRAYAVPPGATITQTDRAILDLKNSRDRLNRFKKKLEMDQDKLLDKAKEFQKQGNKRMAIYLMKLRKHKTIEAGNVDNQLLNVLEMVDKIEGKRNEMEIVNAMQQGKDALEKLHIEMSVDDVLQLMEEIEEQSEVEHQINEILKQGVGMSAADETAIEEELAALERELGDVTEEKSVEDYIEVPSLPKVPVKPLPEAKSVEDKISSSARELIAS